MIVVYIVFFSRTCRTHPADPMLFRHIFRQSRIRLDQRVGRDLENLFFCINEKKLVKLRHVSSSRSFVGLCMPAFISLARAAAVSPTPGVGA
jgi:hypothetical protein